jgi:hypothetical protein
VPAPDIGRTADSTRLCATGTAVFAAMVQLADACSGVSCSTGRHEKRVLLSTYWSCGDVEPTVGLAVQLGALGAAVRVCAPTDFAELLAAVGVPGSDQPARTWPARAQAVKAFAQKVGGQLLADVVHVEYQPIEFAMPDNNVNTRRAVMTAGNMVSWKRARWRMLIRSATTDQSGISGSVQWSMPWPAYTVSSDHSGSGPGTVWKI